MAIAPTTVSLEDYLETPYQPDCDFVRGELQERNLGEYEHGTLQMELGFWFRSHRDEWQIKVVAEQRIRVSAHSVRIPDVCLIRANAPRESVRISPPLLCIEILSPEDRLSRTIQVMEDYLAMGVEHLWILDPIERTAYTFVAAGLLHAPGPRLTIAGSPIYLDLPELFSALD